MAHQTTDRRINSLLTNSIYLVFSSLKNQQRFAQSKVTHRFFTLPENTKKLTNLKNIVIRNGRIVWKHGSFIWYFCLNLKFLGLLYNKFIKTAKDLFESFSVLIAKVQTFLKQLKWSLQIKKISQMLHVCCSLKSHSISITVEKVVY